MSKKLFIQTLGCAMNVRDSEHIIAELSQKEDYSLTQNIEEADLILINTCSVREKPVHKLFSEVGAFEKAIVRTIELPSTVSFLWGTCFHEARIDNLIFHGTQPPQKYGYWEFLGAKIKHIYVPDESVESYRSANLVPWLEYEPLSKYHS